MYPLKKNNSLNQLRLVNKNHNYLTDKQLINLNKKISNQTKNLNKPIITNNSQSQANLANRNVNIQTSQQ